MYKSLIFFIRFFAFWLLFFLIDRSVFLFVFNKQLTSIPFKEIIATLYHGLRLDLSMTAYLNIIPLLYFISGTLIGKSIFKLNWIKTYNLILLILFCLLSVVNFNIYREWGAKVNQRAFEFLIDTPNEALASSASSPIGFSLLVFTGLLATALLLHTHFIKSEFRQKKNSLGLRLIFSLLLLGLNFLAIRGGIGVAPNNQSMAYFSRHPLLNHAAVNTEWNLISGLLASKKTHKNPYLYFNADTAVLKTRNLFKVSKDTSISILTTKKPNIVLVILESFTAQLTKTLGNENDITPYFDQLIKEGFLFSRIYAAGNRTDKGLIGTLTGFPTLGTGSIVKWPEKMQRIPAISQVFAANQYHTSFFYGGESEFDNYKAFILSHGYQQLTDKNSFNSKDMNSKWGAFDGLVFQKQLEMLNQNRQPFFSTLLTLTNHEPFEVPGNYRFGKSGPLTRFKSTAYYTDSCIRAYLSAARKQKWYKNTLFIFIADHGHPYPKEKYTVFMPQRYHIPMLFYGDVLKKEWVGKRMDKIGSQQDLAATLLSQLNMDTKAFIWSKNLLNPYTKNFAFFSWDDGLGFIDPMQCVTFDNVGKTILYESDPQQKTATQKNLDLGKAYLQTAFQQFITL